MGMLQIETWGSFPQEQAIFTAEVHGHAHAVAEAIQYLAEVVLPNAIDLDHRLHGRGSEPELGFGRPPKWGTRRD